jgi:hypothetical protein
MTTIKLSVGRRMVYFAPRQSILLAVVILWSGCTKISSGGVAGSGGAGAYRETDGASAAVDGSVVDSPTDLSVERMLIVSVKDGPTSGGDAQIVDGAGLVNDARLSVDAVCVPDGGAYVSGAYGRRCGAPTANECDSSEDVNPKFPNGKFGNGYDDDCDGKVDEGCLCDDAHPVGTTKRCSLASPTQIDPATMQPAGWCKENSLGTVRCVSTGEEFAPSLWDGECRGAQPPFADDVCAAGDFDCDGKELNSKTQDCACKVDVHCPTEPIVTKPFPDPTKLMAIDGSTWAVGGAASASNWKWTVIGGDCDNILPHPTFAVYGQPRAAVGGLRLSSNVPQTGLGANGNQHGFVVGPAANVGPIIYPAFALSGDYLATGEWDSPDGHHSCTVKVQVRSPGLRVEMCWDNMPQDVDLHLARLQNPVKCPRGNHGWFATCADDERGDDCYFEEAAGCRGFSSNPSSWGYARSADTACHGWGSNRTQPCDNPRLDVDNIFCDPAEADPLKGGDDVEGFCTPENINLDNPKDGERFVVGVHYYDNIIGSNLPHPHVNIYCNGERRLAFGFDPTALPPKTFPRLLKPGLERSGDMWEVATVEARVNAAGALEDCLLTPVHSKVPRPDRDGSTDMCVDTNPRNSPTLNGADRWQFNAAGTYPATAAEFCWH